MKREFFVLLFVASLIQPFFVWAEDVDPEAKAKEIHTMASSDVIYTQEETKALYYQNVQIISLLKEIRDLLDSRLEKKTEKA